MKYVIANITRTITQSCIVQVDVENDATDEDIESALIAASREKDDWDTVKSNYSVDEDTVGIYPSP